MPFLVLMLILEPSCEIILMPAGVMAHQPVRNEILSSLNLNIVNMLSPFFSFVWKEISNLKFGKDGFEVQRLKQDVERTIQRAIHGRSIDSEALDDLFKTVELNEWMTLVLSRMLMRHGLVSLISDHGLGVSPSLNKLIPMCFDRKLLSEQERDDLEKLRNVTFFAEWWDGTKPTKRSSEVFSVNSPLPNNSFKMDRLKPAA